MRIISGIYKGRNIPLHKNFKSRPTTDFAKENLFNILNNNFNLEQIEVLDLFAGTGSISYEFASRMCKRVVCVEKDYHSIKFIQSTTHLLKTDVIDPVKMDVFKYIEKCEEKFDIIFADPPYDLKRIKEVPQAILDADMLSDNGWLIMEHGKNTQFNDILELIDKRSYGSVQFSIFKPKKE